MPDRPARCGYRGCDAELPSPGPRGGRPRTFHRDTRWDGDRPCGRIQELRAELEQTRRNATAAQAAAAARDAELSTQLTACGCPKLGSRPLTCYFAADGGPA
jgi:hypothetical protein